MLPSSARRMQKKDFYVNDNFKGSFTVVESKCGKEPIIENDRLQFKIPENGVYLFNKMELLQE